MVEESDVGGKEGALEELGVVGTVAFRLLEMVVWGGVVAELAVTVEEEVE